MKILTVVPLAKNAFVDELTYFSVREAPLGSVVEITLRNKPALGLVVGSSDAGDMKALIRGGTFSLKKVGAAPPRPLLSHAFITAVQHAATYHATHRGTVLRSMLPSPLLDDSLTPHQKNPSDPSEVGGVYEVRALQAPEVDRYASYKNIVRERFAKRESVLIVAPNARVAEALYERLSPGIARYVYTHHSKLGKKALVALWQQLAQARHAMAIIVTPGYMYVPRNDIGTIIIEQSANDGYIQVGTPHLDTRVCIRYYAQALKAQLIYGESILPAAVHKELAAGTAYEIAPLHTTARSKTRVHVVDARLEAAAEHQQSSFSALTPVAIATIRTALTAKQRIFILVPRRGLAPLTVCRDCKNVVVCDACGASVTLHKAHNESREFLCKKCGVSKPADIRCVYCDSWRLDTLGIGIELVENELADLFPKTPVTRVDKHTCKTDKHVRDALTTFEERGGILLGTQLALGPLQEADVSIVVSLDAMLAVPDFSIDETAFRLLLTLKEKTTEQLLIQTRTPERSVLTAVVEGSIAAFMRAELSLREQLKYPPYTTMLRITKTGTKKKIIEEFQKIMPLLEPYNPRVFKQFERVRPNVFALHCLIRMPSMEWPDVKLVEILKSLQPAFTVRVNPSEVM